MSSLQSDTKTQMSKLIDEINDAYNTYINSGNIDHTYEYELGAIKSMLEKEYSLQLKSQTNELPIFTPSLSRSRNVSQEMLAEKEQTWRQYQDIVSFRQQLEVIRSIPV